MCRELIELITLDCFNSLLMLATRLVKCFKFIYINGFSDALKVLVRCRHTDKLYNQKSCRS